MRVILKAEVPNLGDAGALVQVKPGYARNFLIPRGLAIPASEGSVKELEHQKRVAEAIRRKNKAEAETLAQRIAGTPVSIRCEAGEDDKLFGSVTNRDIAAALEAEGIQIDRKLIQLGDNIRSVGMYNVPIRLHKDVNAEIKVYVIRA